MTQRLESLYFVSHFQFAVLHIIFTAMCLLAKVKPEEKNFGETNK